MNVYNPNIYYVPPQEIVVSQEAVIAAEETLIQLQARIQSYFRHKV